MNISVNEAKEDKLFYVVANLVIVNTQTKECLLLRRSQTEKVYPEKWAFPGGKLEHGEITELINGLGTTPLDGVNGILGILAKREAKEECGLEVESDGNTILKNKVFVRPDGVPVMMVSIFATYVSGEVVLEEGSFTDHAWVTLQEMSDYDIIPGSEEEVKKSLQLVS